MGGEKIHYASYLVRLWRDGAETGPETAVFRAEVEHIQTGQRHHFHTPADLYTFLSQPPFAGEQHEAIDD